MITEEKRRKIVDDLRYCADMCHSTGVLDSDVLNALGVHCGDTDGVSSAYDVEQLADLIDRQTIIPEASGPGFWRCPACGAFNRNDAVWDCCGPIPANHCGNCGSVIVK